MATIRKSDLIKKGVDSLVVAEKLLDSGNNEAGMLASDIAFGYARLADALGEKTLAVRDRRAVGNW